MTRLLFFLLILAQNAVGQNRQNNQFFVKDDSVNLYVFVGEKISLVEYNPNDDRDETTIEIDSITGDTTFVKNRSLVVDHAFQATYMVLQNVFNDLQTDTIIFKAFDHNGRPAFEKHSTVLLYLSKSINGSYFFHQKYQFDPLKKARNGLWVGENGESIKRLFKLRKKRVLKPRGIFD